MLKINEELQAISSQTITDEVQEPKLVAKTPAPAKEKAPATTAETQVETVKSTPAKVGEKPAVVASKEKEPKTAAVQSPTKGPNGGEKKKGKKEKGTFEFPEGGWECSKCQNYNFKGRKECNRCKKVRSKQDLSGKPMHLLKSEKKDNDASAGLKLQRVKMQKNSKFKNLKVDTNLSGATGAESAT